MRHIISFLYVVILVSACNESHQESREDDRRITEEQKALANVTIGRLEYRLMSAVISCTGEIEVPPQGLAAVTAPLGAYLVKTSLVPGMFVRKGDVLATVSNPEYVALQQSWLETKSELSYAEQEYARQKVLQEESATALKRLQQSESTLNVLKARLAGLNERLQLIGIDPEKLDASRILTQLNLRAPIAGYISAVNFHPGEYADATQPIFEIVDLNQLHLHLNAFEKDVAAIRDGQAIRFRPAGRRDTVFHRATVSFVSPRRGSDARTFDVHAHIETSSDGLKPGMYVEAEIFTSNDSTYAIPDRAVVREGNEYYLVVERNGKYEMQPVQIGLPMDGWVEIKNGEALNRERIVVEGASRVFAALRRS